MITPYYRALKRLYFVSFVSLTKRTLEGTDWCGRSTFHSLTPITWRVLTAYCCLHSSGFTLAGGPPPRPPLPPARAPRRDGGRSSSESSLKFSNGVRKKLEKTRNVRERAYHTVKFVNVVVVVIIIVIVIVIIVIVREHVVFERLASEIVNSTRYDLHMGIKGETR